jgi:hypothetical protein
MTITEAKEELRSIRRLDMELKALEKEQDKLRADIYSIHATNYVTDKIVGGKSVSFVDKLERLYECKKRSDERWDELIDTRTVIRAKIDRVDDYIHRALLIDYYVAKNTWEIVCVNLGYSWKQMHRYHRQALEAYATANSKDDIE